MSEEMKQKARSWAKTVWDQHVQPMLPATVDPPGYRPIGYTEEMQTAHDAGLVPYVAPPVSAPVIQVPQDLDTEVAILARVVVHISPDQIRRDGRAHNFIAGCCAEALKQARIEDRKRGGVVRRPDTQAVLTELALLSRGRNRDDYRPYAEQVIALWQRAAHLMAYAYLTAEFPA